MTIQSSRNLVWFTEAVSDAVWSFNIGTHVFTKYPIPTPYSFPFGIAIDKQGNIWFTELEGNKLGEISANSSSVTEVGIPLNAPYGAEPSGITVDDNDRIWMTMPGVNGIASYYQGNFQFYNMTGLVVSPVGIAADSQGNLWFTQHGPSFLSEFNPSTHYFRTISTFVPPPPLNTSLPYFDYVDSNGNVLLNEHYGNAIAVFDPATETMTEYEIPTRPAFTGGIAGMLTMTLSPQNIPWFTELFTGSVGMVNTSKPVGLSLTVQNNTGMFGNVIHIGNGSSFSVNLSVESANSTGVTLDSSIGNFTGSTALTSLPPNSTDWRERVKQRQQGNRRLIIHILRKFEYNGGLCFNINNKEQWSNERGLLHNYQCSDDKRCRFENNRDSRAVNWIRVVNLRVRILCKENLSI